MADSLTTDQIVDILKNVKYIIYNNPQSGISYTGSNGSISLSDDKLTADISNLESGCITFPNSLISADLRGFIINGKSLDSMFSNCINLTDLNLSNWDTSNITSASNMFNNISNVRIKISDKWTLEKNTTSYGGTNLKFINIDDGLVNHRYLYNTLKNFYNDTNLLNIKNIKNEPIIITPVLVTDGILGTITVDYFYVAKINHLVQVTINNLILPTGLNGIIGSTIIATGLPKPIVRIYPSCLNQGLIDAGVDNNDNNKVAFLCVNTEGQLCVDRGMNTNNARTYTSFTYITLD